MGWLATLSTLAGWLPWYYRLAGYPLYLSWLATWSHGLADYPLYLSWLATLVSWAGWLPSLP
jgi:hypothetical protein